MKNTISRIKSFVVHSLILFSMTLLVISCSEPSKKYQDFPIRPISISEINSFQEDYGASFNAIANAIADESYYELKAKEHIENFYNFKEGEVIFKIGYDDNTPFRNTHAGLLSYLIGKNKEFPNDDGIAKKQWRKMNWNNMATIMERDVAIAFGRVTMESSEEYIEQNYTMVLKRAENGKVKLIAHKVSGICQ